MSSIQPFMAGGAQTVISDLVRSIRERGYVVDEVYRGPMSYARGPTGGRWTIPVGKIVTRSGFPTTRSILRELKSFVVIFKLLIITRPGLVYIHFIKREAAYFFLFRWIFGYRLVLGARGSDVLVSKGHLHDSEIAGVISRADAVIANSQAVGLKVESMASRKIPIATVYNGVDIRFWTRPGIKKEPDIPIIVTVGRLEYVKGHDVLIQAFVRVHEQFPEAQLLIIGDGSKRASLEELAKTVGLNRHVSFLGTLDRIAIRNQLHDASIFAMPSRSEGFGLAALEAMATGLPVIGSRVGGLPEVVGEEAGILVEPEDPEALAGAMLHMFETPGLLAQMSEAAIKRASLFSWENAVDSYLSVFAGTRTREGEFLEAPYAMARGEIIPEQ